MCGITAVFSKEEDIFLDLYESLYHLQHRGQDSFGFSYFDDNGKILLIKQQGLLSNTNYNGIPTNIGIGHVRYPTKGKNTINECQPLFLRGTFHTISIVHNGQVQIESIKEYLKDFGVEINQSITSDSSYLLYILGYLLNRYEVLNDGIIIEIIKCIQKIVKGSFNCICLIEGYGLICFKDKYSIRPLILGKNGENTIISSESISITSIEYEVINDIYGNDIIIFNKGESQYRKLITGENPLVYFKPCIFEWVYLARKESIIYNVNVYQARLKMGEFLSEKIKRTIDTKLIDCVVPIPDTSRPIAMEVSKNLQKPYSEAITKNRYVNRTFIMNSQEKRKKNIKRKLNVIQHIIQGKNILIIDDSIVRGNTIKHIINLLKDYQVNKIYIAISSPKIINTNKFGIDIPTKEELICFQKTNQEIEHDLGVEKLIFQDLSDLEKSIPIQRSSYQDFEKSIFYNDLDKESIEVDRELRRSSRLKSVIH